MDNVDLFRTRLIRFDFQIHIFNNLDVRWEGTPKVSMKSFETTCTILSVQN